MNLLEQGLQLLRVFALAAVYLPDDLVNILGVLSDTHVVERRHRFLLVRDVLEGIGQLNQVLECLSEELCGLLVLSSHCGKIFLDLSFQGILVERSHIEVRLNWALKHLDQELFAFTDSGNLLNTIRDLQYINDNK